MSDWEIIEGDCIEAMRAMPEASVDAIVTDPPYGLEFMGKEWDRLRADVGGRDDLRASLKGERSSGGEFGKRIGISYGTPNKNPRCRKCYRLKHDHPKSRCGCAAPSWDLRKSEYGYAMQWWHEAWATEALRVLKPGSHVVAFGGTRTYHRLACALEDAGFEIRDSLMWVYGSGFPKSHNLDGDREGWGTALKPAHEPIVLARKPLVGTVAANVEQHGTGALNVDGCRVPATGRPEIESRAESSVNAYGDGLNGSRATGSTDTGRWPPNLLLTHAADCTEADCGETCPVAEMDRQSGESGQQAALTGNEPRSDGMSGPIYGSGKGSQSFPLRGDSAEASRFFPRFKYVAKASSGERNAGLDEPSSHPTVKPVALMRWLCRLITPPGGTVLDPFAGSGTTLLAATQEGFRCIGIEREPEYAAIARRRIEEDAPLFNRGTA